MRNPLSRYVSSNTIFIFAIYEFTFVSLVFAILAFAAGQSASTLQEAAILTCDTTAVSATVQAYLNSSVPITGVPDWFELHYFTVCHGLWLNGSSIHGKNLASLVCENRPVGYTFSLASEIAAHVPVAAMPLFADWPPTYGIVPTRNAFGLLAAAIGVGISSLICHLYGLVKASKSLPDRRTLNFLRVGLITGIATAILFTDSAAQITNNAYKMRGMSPADVPVPLNIWTEAGFYVFVWLGMTLIWLAVAVSMAFSIILRKKLALQTDRPNFGQELLMS